MMKQASDQEVPRLPPFKSHPVYCAPHVIEKSLLPRCKVLCGILIIAKKLASVTAVRKFTSLQTYALPRALRRQYSVRPEL
jgi:hypothetical protein